jgi:hypothetical protein
MANQYIGIEMGVLEIEMGNWRYRRLEVGVSLREVKASAILQKKLAVTQNKL